MKLPFYVLTILAAVTSSAATADEPNITPGDNLVISGMAAIPASIAEAAFKYSENRSAAFAGWHPSKREMLVVTRFGNAPQVHAVSHPGGARRQITFYGEPVGWASYDPAKGEFVCFSRDSGGSEFFQLYRYDLATGDATLLTDGKKRNGGAVWTRSGSRIAYTRVDADAKGAFTEIHLQDPRDPKSDRMLVRLEGGGWDVGDWSHDEKQLGCLEFLSGNDANLWIVDASSGEKTLLTPKQPEQTIAYSRPLFSADDKALFTATDAASEFQQLARIDLATREHHYLTKDIAWDVASYDLSHDGRSLAFATNEDGVSRLHIIDASTGDAILDPKLPMGVILNLEWHRNNRDLAFTLTTPRSPADAYSINLDTQKIDRWTESETGGLNTSEFPEPEILKWKSFDGRMISGFLNKPPARFTGRRPVIINIHGGPEGQSRPAYLGRSNYYLNELGIALIHPNVRGSEGYGKTFLKLDNGMLREDSYKDIESLLDAIETREDLDPKRIMITGGSYGGHMTLALATRANDRIACAVDVVGISNLRTFLENTQGYRRDLRRVEYGDEREEKMRKFLEETAPLNHSQNITKPLFVIQGRNDPRVPISEADQIVETVRKNGTPVWYLIANDEGHGFQKKPNQDFQFYSTIHFVQQYLLQ